MMDARDYEAEFGKSGEGFNEKEMTLSVEVIDDETDDEVLLTFPAKYIVCELCDGTGSHVNPAIDAHGISMQEFAEDPDFHDEYMRGTYDVSCYRCHGKRVEPVVDEDNANKEDLKRYHEKLKDDALYAREVEAERKMGA